MSIALATSSLGRFGAACATAGGALEDYAARAGSAASASKEAASAMKDASVQAKQTAADMKTVESTAHELGGALVEASQQWDAASTTLTAVQVKLYQLQDDTKQTFQTSKETLDALEHLVEEKVPGLRVWLSKWIEDAHVGTISTEELLKRISDFVNDPGATQLMGGMPGYIGDVQEFIRAFNVLTQAMKDSDAAASKLAK